MLDVAVLLVAKIDANRQAFVVARRIQAGGETPAPDGTGRTAGEVGDAFDRGSQICRAAVEQSGAQIETIVVGPMQGDGTLVGTKVSMGADDERGRRRSAA